MKTELELYLVTVIQTGVMEQYKVQGSPYTLGALTSNIVDRIVSVVCIAFTGELSWYNTHRYPNHLGTSQIEKRLSKVGTMEKKSQ